MRVVTRRRSIVRFLSALLAALLVAPWAAFASTVDVAVVDVVAPVTEVSLEPGQSGAIVITATVTGKQDGTATFKVYKDWVLENGSFTGANPVEFTVGPRAAQDEPDVFTLNGSVSVASSQAAGQYVLAVTAFGITNSNATGAKLADGRDGTYRVVVTEPQTLADTTPPVLLLPDDIVAEAESASGAAVTWTASATDDVDGDVPVVCTPASGSTFPLGETVVACSATDAAGNTTTGSFKVTVVDTTAPVIVPPGSVSVEAEGPSGAVVTFSATASDLVDGDVPVLCDPPSGSTFPLGETTVYCSATDAAGNTAHAEFTVIVSDTTAPVLSLPGDIVAEATGPSGAVVEFVATASDLVDGDVPVLCDPPSGSTFPLGETAVACSATDAAGNEATGSFKVTVVDTTPPVVVVPADMTVEATGPEGAVVEFLVVAWDAVSGTVPVVCDPPSGSTFPLGETTVHCSATDAAGNTATASFTVTVVDTTPPALSLPDDIIAEATGPSGAVVSFSASAYDLVDGDVTVVCTPASGSTFPLGETTVVCTATDGAGNSATGVFSVTVRDTTPPELTVPGDLFAYATCSAGAAVTFAAPSATDLVDPAPFVTCSWASGSTFPLGVTWVTCTATDFSGNSASASFKVTVAYAWSGILQPINADGSSVFKAGSTVPVKFRLTGASAGITDAVARVYVARIDGEVVGTEVEASSSTPASTGNLFRYDPVDDLYIYNYGTKGMQPGTYQLRIDLGDGEFHIVRIGLRK